MGKPNCVKRNYSAQAGCVPGEVKHLSNQRKRNRKDSLSSGERTGISLNLSWLTYGLPLADQRGGRLHCSRKRINAEIVSA